MTREEPRCHGDLHIFPRNIWASGGKPYGEVSCSCGERRRRVWIYDIVIGSCKPPCKHPSCGGTWHELDDVDTIHSIYTALYKCDGCGAVADCTSEYTFGEPTGEPARSWADWLPPGEVRQNDT